MKALSVSEVKARALAIVEHVRQRGEGVIVTRHGKPIARIVPYQHEAPVPGTLAHTLIEEVDIMSPLGSGDWSAAK